MAAICEEDEDVLGWPKGMAVALVFDVFLLLAWFVVKKILW